MGNGSVGAFLSFDEKLGILTPNAPTPYYLAFADQRDNPPKIKIVSPEGKKWNFPMVDF